MIIKQIPALPSGSIALATIKKQQTLIFSPADIVGQKADKRAAVEFRSGTYIQADRRVLLFSASSPFLLPS